MSLRSRRRSKPDVRWKAPRSARGFSVCAEHVQQLGGESPLLITPVRGGHVNESEPLHADPMFRCLSWRILALALRHSSGTIQHPGPELFPDCPARHPNFVRVLMSGDLLSFACLHLSEAVFCADCEMVSNSKNACRCCGSSALLMLSHVLGGSLRNVPQAVVVEWRSGATRMPIAIEFPSSDGEAAAAA